MANNTITFDPATGVSYSANLTVNTGANFKSTFKVIKPDKSAFNFTGYSGSSQMVKSVAVGATNPATASLTVGFTSAIGGEFNLSIGSTTTRTIKPGRYVWDMLVSSGSTIYRLVEGNVLVLGGISSAP